MGYVLAALVHIGLIINLVAVGALIFIWLERKISGRIQDRLGPTRVGGKFGWLQTLADGIKLITKEDLMPDGADGMLFRIAPYISFGAVDRRVRGDSVRGRRLSVGRPAHQHRRVLRDRRAGARSVRRHPGRVLVGVEVVAVRRHARGGPGGQLRSAAGHVRGRAGAAGRVDGPGRSSAISRPGWFTNWYLFNDPATFIIFWVYFTCATASVNRAPFDLAEAESELVAGFHTEYSGLRWSFFFMAEYGSMLTVSLLASILFLGGWHGPIPITSLLGLQPGGWFAGVAGDGVAHFVCQSAGLLNVLVKGVIGVSRDDVGSLDAAAAAHRPGDDDLPEVLHADRGGDVPGRGAVAVLRCRSRNFFGLTRRAAATYAVNEGWAAPARGRGEAGGAGRRAAEGDAGRRREDDDASDDGRRSSLRTSPWHGGAD